MACLLSRGNDIRLVLHEQDPMMDYLHSCHIVTLVPTMQKSATTIVLIFQGVLCAQESPWNYNGNFPSQGTDPELV
jgi:hypothetical protein